jgi:hypothetical protein
VPERLDTAALSPSAYIRMLLPLTHPAAGRDLQVTLASAEEALWLHADVLMTQRYGVPDEAAATALLTHAECIKAPFVYDLDDSLADLPIGHPDSARLMPKIGVVIALLAGAHRVHVTTSHLASRIIQFTARGSASVKVIPNGLDERIWPHLTLTTTRATFLKTTTVTPPVCRILYMGSSTHSADLDLVMPVLKRLHETFTTRIAIDIVGIQSASNLPAFLTRIEVPHRAAASYPAFVSWLTDRQHTLPWSIGIAPLEDTLFNRCKSPLKLLDYAALGLPVVASNMSVYRVPYLVSFGKSTVGAAGYLAANETQWYHALAQLVRQPALRLDMAVTAVNALFHQYSLQAQASMRRAALDDVMQAPRPQIAYQTVS